MICTIYHPLRHNILLYSALNKIIPATQCYTKPKSFSLKKCCPQNLVHDALCVKKNPTFCDVVRCCAPLDPPDTPCYYGNIYIFT